jgi:sigma-B regulation protein RsbU (phosphoserine phosphatase)
MATELHIAYQVQKSLLPRSNPTLSGFDIAGHCIPAKEVGGDYYDFFPLGDNKLGIVIGDVSGKGVPAAIYMTLTKGIIQSHTHNLDSPGEVLKNVNKLLYQILEPGSFVSMYFAVLDGTTREISCARAGHNEAILYSSRNNQTLNVQPEGIGLGLEKGNVFDSKIKEQIVQLNSNDILIFYTDGFTEAMNHRRELFGEKRLHASLLENQDKKMVDLIQSVSTDVKNFVGNSSQYDDMTIIGIKAL